MAQRRGQGSTNGAPISNRSTLKTAKPPQPQPPGTTAPMQTNGKVMGEDARTRIQKLAYQLYQERGRQDGYAEQDWLKAERATLAQLDPGV